MARFAIKMSFHIITPCHNEHTGAGTTIDDILYTITYIIIEG